MFDWNESDYIVWFRKIVEIVEVEKRVWIIVNEVVCGDEDLFVEVEGVEVLFKLELFFFSKFFGFVFFIEYMLISLSC